MAPAILGAAPKTMSVQVKKAEIRTTASPLASVAATVNYGDKLTVLEQKNSWAKVTTADQTITGWVHSSALTTDKIVLTAAAKDAKTGASSGEMALAGKGFTPQVEAQFKAKHADIDFTWIDKMVQMKMSVDELKTFITDGALTMPGTEGGTK
jgi:SH3-like domain-containing protein